MLGHMFGSRHALEAPCSHSLPAARRMGGTRGSAGKRKQRDRNTAWKKRKQQPSADAPPTQPLEGPEAHAEATQAPEPEVAPFEPYSPTEVGEPLEAPGGEPEEEGELPSLAPDGPSHS